MTKRDLLVSGAVAVACSAILVVFTDIEVDLLRWINCSAVAVPTDRQSAFCQRHGHRQHSQP